MELTPLPSFRQSKPKILDFDIENRPLSYWYDGKCTAEITAIAASWVGNDKIHCWALGEVEPEVMLKGFLDLYNKADEVTGHYIIKHDLPIINGALMEHGMSPLGPKLVQDTKLHLKKMGEISRSQESLLAMYELGEKVQMSQADWREANRLTPRGIALTKRRVTEDVRQHKLLRERLKIEGLLHPAKEWKP